MILTIIKMHGLPAKRKEIVQTINDLDRKVAKEEGCVNAAHYQDLKNKDIHFIVEEWKTEKDLKRYTNSKSFNVLMGLGVLLTKPPEITHIFQKRTRTRTEGNRA